MLSIVRRIGVVAIAVAILDATVATVLHKLGLIFSGEVAPAIHCVRFAIKMAAGAISAFALYIPTAAAAVWNYVVVLL
jgi:hypothetical protein